MSMPSWRPLVSAVGSTTLLATSPRCRQAPPRRHAKTGGSRDSKLNRHDNAPSSVAMITSLSHWLCLTLDIISLDQDNGFVHLSACRAFLTCFTSSTAVLFTDRWLFILVQVRCTAPCPTLLVVARVSTFTLTHTHTRTHAHRTGHHTGHCPGCGAAGILRVGDKAAHGELHTAPS